MTMGQNIGNVVGNTSPQEFKFALRNFAANVGDLITVDTKVPNEDGKGNTFSGSMGPDYRFKQIQSIFTS